MRRRARGLLLSGLLVLPGCLPASAAGTLPPTLEILERAGRRIALQNDMPVPSFDWQPRPRIELDGRWRVERVDLDVSLTMAARDEILAAIETEAAGRHLPAHDDRSWQTADVPGTVNPPLEGVEGGAWYRRAFDAPPAWAGRAVSLRFDAVNYVADVWLNGVWLGYHEGGRTPFALDVANTLLPGDRNVVAVRVHTIPMGTRFDVMPWGLVDWWNYGGITGPVWLEAAPPAHVVRADVRPHLDAVDVELVLAQPERLAGIRTAAPGERAGPGATLVATIYPATVDDGNLLDPDPRSLIRDPATALVSTERDIEMPIPGEVTGASFSIGFGEADLWSPTRPALYVLRVDVLWADRPMDAREARMPDSFWTTFGIRHVQVDPQRPRVLLNGEPAFFRGVGLHAESLTFGEDGRLVGGTPHQPMAEIEGELRAAATIGADLIRTGHEPADPRVLMLADRLGFAVWEEIPLYHATPAIFEQTMARGLPQQMLREMALRDMNRPSVMFHGFANESTGEAEREAALAELHEVDRAIDGTRLTGQVGYGWQPTDPTHAPLDVAGYTFYHGVFYGDEPGIGTRRALRQAHEAHPDKPIMVLEFGRWADTPRDEERQAVIFEETYRALERHRADRVGGFVSAATWWTLLDFATQIRDIEVEDFGLIRPDGSLRPAGQLAAAAFDAGAGQGSELTITPDIERPRADPVAGAGEWALPRYLAYGLGLSIGLMGLALLVLTRRGGRAVGRRR